jgi:dihydroorotate dehydrogenase (NAD+) catalytic subunit
MGGIQNADDAVEFIMAGASAVAVGTANFYEPQTALQVLAGLRDFMVRNRIADVRELVGAVQTDKPSA